MNNFKFIESAVVLGIKNTEEIKVLPFAKKDFAIFGEAFEFVINYIDKNKSAPPSALLEKQFPDLDLESNGTALNYACEEFQKQILYRRVVGAFKENQELLKQEPKKALEKILSQLENINIIFDDSIQVYDSDTRNGLKEYEERKKLRAIGLKILGIPTCIKSINRTGVGWMPGEIVTLFARPSAGKTWLGLKSAAVSMKYEYRTLFITTEMPTKQIELRLDVLLANMLGYKISHTALRTGSLTPSEEKDYAEYLAKMTAKKLLVCDHIEEGSLSLLEIKKLIKKYSPEFVVIDGIHLLSGGERGKIWEKMHQLFYGAKNVSIATKVAMMITTQASRGADTFSPPSLNDVAFSDAAFQASDILLSLSRVEQNEKERTLQIQKYRDGNSPTFYVILEWDVDTGHISEKITQSVNT